MKFFWLSWLLCCTPAMAAGSAVALTQLQPAVRVVLEISPPHQTLQHGEVAGLTTTLVRQLLTELQLEPGV